MSLGLPGVVIFWLASAGTATRFGDVVDLDGTLLARADDQLIVAVPVEVLDRHAERPHTNRQRGGILGEQRCTVVAEETHFIIKRTGHGHDIRDRIDRPAPVLEVPDDHISGTTADGVDLLSGESTQSIIDEDIQFPGLLAGPATLTSISSAPSPLRSAVSTPVATPSITSS